MKMKKKVLMLMILLGCLLFIPNVLAADIKGCQSILPDISIDVKIANTVHTVILVIQIAVPILLVIFGMLDLFKSITAQKEDEIKKGQQIFIKRLIAAVLVFFVFVIVKVVIGVAADGTKNEILDCTECFISNECDSIFDGIKDAIENIKDNIENIYDKETKK